MYVNMGCGMVSVYYCYAELEGNRIGYTVWGEKVSEDFSVLD